MGDEAASFALEILDQVFVLNLEQLGRQRLAPMRHQPVNGQ